MLKLMAVGRLTNDPDIRWTQGNQPMCIARFNIAINRRFKREGQPEADFHSCTAFGRTAEFVDKYFSKGQRIALEGTLQNNNYTDQQGVKHYGEQIIVESVEFCESKNSGEQRTASPAAQPAEFGEGFMYIPDNLEDEGLPFN